VVEKEGYNPKTDEKTITTRRVVTIDKDIPLFGKPDGKDFIERIII
jgi:tRNA(His)-5'-guanylyltransferase (EC 2.7.7.-)